MVTTAVGESERLVRHGVTGFVVPVGDSGRFRAALARLVTDEALRWRFRDALEREPPRRWEETFGDFEAAMRAVDSSLG
jgi:glycosyltransferase involved in cell wall biosynthesis